MGLIGLDNKKISWGKKISDPRLPKDEVENFQISEHFHIFVVWYAMRTLSI